MKTMRFKLIVYSSILACVFAGCLFCATTNASAEEDATTCTAMNRLYNPYTGEHFYTASADERDGLIEKGWSDEGTGWIAPKTSNTPVYRLYNKYAGDHHYTLSAKERDNLVKVGWTDEGIGWYSDDNKEVALLRQYNPNAKVGAHNFTTSTDENASLVRSGWSAEGVSWYGIKHDHTWNTTHYSALTHQEAIYESKSHSICSFCGIDDLHKGDEKYEVVKSQDIFFFAIKQDGGRYFCGHSSVYKYSRVKGYKTIVDREAYDKKRCSGCGAIDGYSASPSGARVWTVKIETGAAPMPEFYVEDGYKLTENTQKFNNKIKWRDSTFSARGSDGQVHSYGEGKTDAGKHQPYMIFRWDWVFQGYYSDKDCTKKFDFNTPITKDMTIYVKWAHHNNGSEYLKVGQKVYEHYRLGNSMWRYITCNGKTQKMLMSEGFGENMRLINGALYNGVEYNKKAQVNIIEFGETEDTITPWQDYPSE